MIEYLGEKIEAAAIRYPDGLILMSDRHFKITKAQAERGVKTLGDAEQGFVTDRDRFVDRMEAAAIARRAGQISKGYKGELYSEDIFKGVE